MLQLSYSWLAIAVDVSVKALLLSLLAGLTLAVLRVRDTNVRHRVWTAVLVGMLAMPVLVFTLRDVMPSVPVPDWMTLAWQIETALESSEVASIDSDGNVRDPNQILPDDLEASDVAGEFPNTLPLRFDDSQPVTEGHAAPPLVEAAGHAATTHDPVVPHRSSNEGTPTSAKGRSFGTNWPIMLLLIYVTITSVLLLRLALGLVAAHRLVRQSRRADCDMTPDSRRRARILEHDRVYVPLTVGFFRPTVLLPAEWRSWSGEKLQAVLAHELAHVRRGDWLVALLAELNGAVYWFHPLAWVLKRKLSALAERSCDDAVLEADTCRTEYARYLVEVASSLSTAGVRCRAPRQSVAMARVPSVETRIDAILDSGRPLARKLGTIGVMVLLGVGIPAILLAAALQPNSDKEKDPVAADQRDAKVTVETDDAQPDDDLVHLQGRVLGPDEKAIAGAKVTAASVLIAGPGGYPQYFHSILDQTVSNAEGHFELTFARDDARRSELESKFKLQNPYWGQSRGGWQVLAQTDGYGPAWVHATAVEKDRSLTLQLTEDRPIEGRLVDLEGHPIPGVRLRVRELHSAQSEQAILDWIKDAKRKPHPGTLQDYFFSSDDRYPGLFPTRPNDGGLAAGSPALPADVATDEQGRFKLVGVGANRLAVLEVEGPNITKSILHVVTREMQPVSARKRTPVGAHSPIHFGCRFEFVAEPSQPIMGVVTDAESGEPLPNMVVQVQRFVGNTFSQDGFLVTRTDEAGHYRLDGAPQGGGHVLRVQPELEDAYFETELDVPKATTFVPIQRDIHLRQGVWIRGKVTDMDTGEPIVGATVQYLPLRSNTHAEDYDNYDPKITGSVPDRRFRTSADGSFRVLAIPGEGVMSAIAQNENTHIYATMTAQDVPDHLVQDNGRLNAYHPWDIRGYHALQAVDVPESVDEVEHNLRLTRGLTREVNLVDSDGRPAIGVSVLGRIFPPRLEYPPLESPAVEILGLHLNENRTVVFIHSDRKLGKAVTITAGDETTLPLDRCAVAKGRVVDGDGLPMTGVGVNVSVDRRQDNWGRMLEGSVTGDDGRFEVLLPPGTQYRIWHFSRPDGPNFSVECDPKPGDLIDLGDVTDGTELDLDDITERTVAADPASDNDQRVGRTGSTSAESPTVTSDRTAGADESTELDTADNDSRSDKVRVSGQVLKPGGEPLEGAKLYWPRTKTDEPMKLDDLYLQQVATSGRDGSFSAELVLFKAPWGRGVPLMAVAEGWGLAWTDISAKAAAETLTLKMSEEFPISGRILSTEGNPVPGASVGLFAVMTDSSGSIDKLLTAWQSEWQSSSMKVDKVLYAGLHLAGDILGFEPADQQGRFTIRGLGKEHAVWITVRSPSMANSSGVVITRDGFVPDPYNLAALDQARNMALRRRQTPKLFANNLTIVAESGKVITGIVTDIETDRPLEGVLVHTSVGYGDAIMATTDANGFYQLTGIPMNDDDVLISFRKPHARYLPRTLAARLSPGLAATEFNAGLARGVVLKGRVTETETGKPVSGGIRFAPLENNEWKDKPGYDNYKRSRVMENVDRDGNFEFVSIPGPGVLLMQAGSSNIEIGGQYIKPYRKGRFSEEDREKVRIYVAGESFYTSSNGLEFFENGMKVVDIPEGVEQYTAQMTVDRGMDVDVTIVDDQGKPLQDVMVCGVTETWPITYSTTEPSIRIYALDPTHPRRVIFYHRQRALACTLVVRGDEKERIVAKLHPTKTLVGRAVDLAGDPLAEAKVNISWSDDTSREFQRQLNMAQPSVTTNEDGRFRIEGAMPGVFRLTFSLDNKRYSTEKKWDDLRTMASTLLSSSGSEVALGDITVKPR